MAQIDTDIWTDLRPLYTGVNTRTGTTAITDNDYENFPPFYTACYAGESNPYIVYNLIKNNKLTLDKGIDETICYVGMYSEDLPQTNIYGFSFDTYDSLSNPFYQTDNTQIQSFICSDMMSYKRSTGWSYGGNRVYNKDFTYYDRRLWIWKDGLQGSYPYPYPVNVRETNPQTMFHIYSSFGIRSLILEINVAYKESDGAFYPSFSKTTLAAYAAQSVAWRETHPILKAYCLPYIRDNTNGRYEHISQYFYEGGVQLAASTVTPLFTQPLRSNVTGYDDLLTYVYSMTDIYTLNGMFPIYGDFSGENNLSTVSTAIENSGVCAVLMGCNRGTLRKLQSSGYMNYWLELEGSTENIEWIRRGAAAYGLFFCDAIDDLADAGRDETRWIDSDMMLGTVNDEGLTNGDYSRGVLNALQKQWNWSDTTQSIYDPSLPPVPENDYNTETVFNDVSTLATMTQRYALTSSNVKGLGAALWTITEDLIDDGGGGQDYSELTNKILDTFLTNNPIDCIVNLRKYPFELPKDNSTYIKLGKYTTSIAGYTISDTVKVFTFRMKKKILPLFENSFLDYEPYTHFELYVPFCGTVSLEPADILDRQLSVKLAADFSTGTCTAYILSDDLVIKTINGQISIEIPVSGIQAVTAASQINNAIAQASTAHKQERSATLGNVSLGGAVQFLLNPVKTIESAGIAENTAQRADYELQHQNIQPHLIGSASSAASWLLDFTCRLLIYYPTGEVLYNTNPPSFDPVKLSEYGHTTGFACCMTGQLQNFTGLTVAVSAALSGISTNTYSEPATLQELQLLEAALNEGVIL